MTTTTFPTSSPSTRAASDAPKALHMGLWVVQALLAAAFLAAGAMKLTAPIADLAQQMAWVQSPMGSLTRFIGLVEVAGALGLVLPAATRIKPWLTPLAALGLVIVMALAAITHVAIGEPGAIVAPLVLGSLAAFVAWGRGRRATLAPR
jgi:putative oxidoreductase